MIKKMSAERFARLGGNKKFTATFSKSSMKIRAGRRQIYRLPSGIYVSRRPK